MRFSLLCLVLAVLPAAADPSPRWKLDYESEVPERFQCGTDGFWGIAYTLTNRGPGPASLDIAHELHRPGEADLRESFLPDAYLEFCAARQGLRGSSRAEKEAALAALQAKGRWLTTSALTARRELAVNESIHGIAVVKEDGRTRGELAVVVQGLVDPAIPWPQPWDRLPLIRYSLRLRTRFASQSGRLVPDRRQWFVALPDAPVDRADLAILVSWLADDNPRVRRTALDLLCCYADPATPRKEDPDAVPVFVHFSDILQALKDWLRANPVILRLQAESPSRRKELAEDLLRRDPVGMKAVAEALNKANDFAAFQVADALVDALDHNNERCGGTAWTFIRELTVRAEFDYDAEALPRSDPAAAKARESWREWAQRFSAETVWDANTGTWEVGRK